MQRCLLIGEVVEQIAQYLYDEKEVWSPIASTRPNSLVSFALTCRALCDPALNVLWRDLQSPYPLAFAFQPGVIPVGDRPFGSQKGEESEEESEESESEEEDSEDTDYVSCKCCALLLFY